MKLRLLFKTPDAVEHALRGIEEPEREEAKEVLEKWIKYDEYVTLEFDIEAGTAKVCES